MTTVCLLIILLTAAYAARAVGPMSGGPPITIGQLEAERLTGLSAKTLERRAAEGEPVGRVKVGRRVVFVRAQLEKWLASKLSISTTATESPESTAPIGPPGEVKALGPVWTTDIYGDIPRT